MRFCGASPVPESRFSNDAEKLAGRLVAELQFGTIEEIFAHGLHDYIDLLPTKLNAIGASLFNAYIFQPVRSLDRTALRATGRATAAGEASNQ